MPMEPSASDTYLVCRSLAQLCLFPIAGVTETFRALPVRRLPDTPDFVLGVSVIRGAATPVLDLARLLGAPSGGGAARYVTIKLDDRQIAVAVDEVVAVRGLQPSFREALPPLLGASENAAVTALASLDGELALVLRGARLLPSGAWDSLGASESAA